MAGYNSKKWWIIMHLIGQNYMGEGGGMIWSRKRDHGSKQGGKTRSLTEIHWIRGYKRKRNRKSRKKNQNPPRERNRLEQSMYQKRKEPWESMFWIRIHIQLGQMEPDPVGHKWEKLGRKNKKSGSFERRSEFYKRNKCTIFLIQGKISVTLTRKGNNDILQ